MINSDFYCMEALRASDWRMYSSLQTNYNHVHVVVLAGVELKGETLKLKILHTDVDLIF